MTDGASLPSELAILSKRTGLSEECILSVLNTVTCDLENAAAMHAGIDLPPVIGPPSMLVHTPLPLGSAAAND